MRNFKKFKKGLSVAMAALMLFGSVPEVGTAYGSDEKAIVSVKDQGVADSQSKPVIGSKTKLDTDAEVLPDKEYVSEYLEEISKGESSINHFGMHAVDSEGDCYIPIAARYFMNEEGERPVSIAFNGYTEGEYDYDFISCDLGYSSPDGYWMSCSGENTENEFHIVFDGYSYNGFDPDGTFIFQVFYTNNDVYIDNVQLYFEDGSMVIRDFEEIAYSASLVPEEYQDLVEIYFDGELDLYEGLDDYLATFTEEDAITGEVTQYEWMMYDYQFKVLDVPAYGVTSDGETIPVDLFSLGYYIIDSQYEEAWIPGNSYEATFDFVELDIKATLTVNIIESNVESIEVIGDTAFELTENVDGYPDNYYYYDEDGNEILDEFFHYDVFDVFNNLSFLVTYKDGTTEQLSGYEMDFRVIDDQYVEHWEPGNTYTVGFSYYGVTIEFEVTIVPDFVESVELVDNNTVDIIEGTMGFDSVHYWYDEDGEEYSEEYFHYLVALAIEDKTVRINYTDGTYEELTLDYILGACYFDDDQEDNHWEVGNTYTTTLIFRGNEIDFEVTIVENPIERIEFYEDFTAEVIENISGAYYDGEIWDDELEEFVIETFFLYDYSDVFARQILKIYYTDGTISLVPLKNLDFATSDDQEVNHWEVGETYEASLVYMDREATLNVTVVENPVESVVPVDDSPIEIYEESFGFWNTYEEYDEESDTVIEVDRFIYDVSAVAPEYELLVTYKDGTSEVVPVSIAEVLFFLQIFEPWDGIGLQEIELNYLGCDFIVPIEIVEDPIDRITCDVSLEAIVDVDGSYVDGYYDEENDEYVEMEYFFYDVENKLNDAYVTIYYLDGTNEEVPLVELPVEITETSVGRELGLGNSFDIVIKYGRHEALVPVEIVENSVKDIEVVAGNEIEVYQNINSFTTSDGDIYVYDLSDVVLKVTYEDGTTENIAYNTYFEFEEVDNQFEKAWEVGGKYSVMIKYAGQSAVVTIKVCESIIKSIEPIIDGQFDFVDVLDAYTNYREYFDEDDNLLEEEYLYYDYADALYNTLFELTYTDGTSETIDFATMEYFFGAEYLTIQEEDEWLPGEENYIYVYVFGEEILIPVTVTEKFVQPSIELDRESATMKTKSKLQLNASYVTNLDEDVLVLWKSSDETIATVDANGLVTAKTYGNVTITAVLVEDGLEATCEINTLFYDVAGSNVKGDKNYQYFYDPVYWAAENGITKGYDGGVYFGPENKCTRQELLIFLWRIAGEPKAKGDARKYFSDVTAGTNTATNKSIAWAYENGITKGYTEGGKSLFKPTQSVTRQETMIFLWRVAGQPTAKGSLKFSDCKNIDKSSATYKAILWGSQNGITGGYPDGSFGLKGDCLREAIVTFLYRFSKLS